MGRRAAEVVLQKIFVSEKNPFYIINRGSAWAVLGFIFQMQFPRCIFYADWNTDFTDLTRMIMDDITNGSCVYNLPQSR
jgi:hypothetical protein